MAADLERVRRTFLAGLSRSARYTKLPPAGFAASGSPKEILKVNFAVDPINEARRQRACGAIASWLLDKAEWRNVGHAGDRSSDVVKGWMSESGTWSCFLVRGDEAGPPTPVGFAVVVLHALRGDIREIEIGRLVLEPALRGQRVASVFLDALLHLVLGVEHRAQVFIRVLRKNDRALKMVGRTMWKGHEQHVAPTWADATDGNVQWYCYDGTRHPLPHFGNVLAKIRLERSLTFEQIAETIGCTPSAVHHIEHGSGLKLETAEALVMRIADTVRERTRMLFALVRQRVPDEIVFVDRFDTEIAEYRKDLWVISDIIYEALDLPESRTELDNACRALQQGRKRWYFVPPSKVDTEHGRGLCNEIIRRCHCVPEGLRLYTAPAPLCRLRVAVFNPAPKLDKMVAELVSIAGPGGGRTPLPPDDASEFATALANAIAPPKFDADPELEYAPRNGFQRIKLTEARAR